MAGYGSTDLLAMVVLGLVVLGLLLYVVFLPPASLAFAIDRPPPQVRLQNFYALERNAAGPFRWTKPEASILLPVVAPGHYRLTLGLQDGLPDRPPRAVTIWINHTLVQTIPLDVTPHDYAITFDIAPVARGADPAPILMVELQAPGVVLPGDPRALGIVVSRVALAPIPAPATLPLVPLTLGMALALAALLARDLRRWVPSVVLRWGPGVPRARGDRARLRAALAGGLGWALVLFGVSRLAFSLLAFLLATRGRTEPGCLAVWPPPVDPAWFPSGLGFRLVGVWQHYDVCWYEQIATFGYLPRDAAVAFLPLYPALMRVASLPVGGSLAAAGMLVSGLAYVVALTGLFRLVRDDFNATIARRTVLYLAVFPTAFFLFAPYTEALFLALAVWSLRAARRGAWGWAGLIAILAALTRTQGCFLALPLAWEAARQWRQGGSAREFWPRRLSSVLAPALPVGGFLLFLVYSNAATGWTTFQAQREQWNYRTLPPWDALAASWGYIWQRGDLTEALNLACLVIFVLVMLAGVRRLPLAYTLYAAPQLLVLLTRDNNKPPLMSTSRLVLVIFPVFVVLALLFRHRRLHAAWLLVSGGLLLYFCYLFFLDTFVA
jgi:hypothetical protein